MYSQDLKQRILSYIKSGGSKAEAARRFNISRYTIFSWLRKPKDYKAVKPGPKQSWKFNRQELAELVKAKPDLLLKELAEHFNVSINAIDHALKRMGITRKKRASNTIKANTTKN